MDQKALDALKKGKTEEQSKVIDYFCKDAGCFSKNISDDEYTQMVRTKMNSLNLRGRALAKIGLDESQVNEITPAQFQGFYFKNAFAKQKANGTWVSSAYLVTWVFFSDAQIYLYILNGYTVYWRSNQFFNIAKLML